MYVSLSSVIITSLIISSFIMVIVLIITQIYIKRERKWKKGLVVGDECYYYSSNKIKGEIISINDDNTFDIKITTPSIYEE